jgi:hypothetical protein
VKTNQEIFDTVAKHLLTQMARSVAFVPGGGFSAEPVEQCRYRGDNGLKCAAGILIPDALYRPVMEGFGVMHGSVSAGLPEVDLDSLPLLRALQIVHDTSLPEHWARELRRVARYNGLNFNAEAYGTQDRNEALYSMPAELPAPAIFD